MPKFGFEIGYAKSAHDGALEQAQFNKMQLICEKLQLKEGERFLDIGCGWGSLARHAGREYGAVGTGVTLSGEGKKYCEEASAAEGSTTETLCCDYRHIPADRKFEKIASIEMAEHVGLRSFVDPYLKSIKERLTPGGMFLMQVAGLRQGSNWEDIAWGLFMSRYIFPGADASTPLNWYIRQLELAGFEVHSVETIGRMYSHTLHKWYDNWMSHKQAILNGSIDAERETLTGERLFRMWEFFLAYSVVASGQGSATCYQILAHPNTYDFPRDRWVHPDHVSYGHEDGSFDYKKSRPSSAVAVFEKEEEADAASSPAATPSSSRRRRGSSTASPKRSSSGRRSRR
jgi:cyclopropane fatty-acyl-phospholipid synthase-like methyltransferase